jgi:hypothetical protein
MSGLSYTPVDSTCAAVFESRRDIGEDFLRLADQDMVGMELHLVRFAAGPWASDERSSAEGASAGEDGHRIGALSMHGAHHNQVRPLQVFIANLVECVVKQSHRPSIGTEGRDCDQTKRRHYGGLRHHLENAFESPE